MSIYDGPKNLYRYEDYSYVADCWAAWMGMKTKNHDAQMWGERMRERMTHEPKFILRPVRDGALIDTGDAGPFGDR
jgi:hypothetical protein